ncbi:hypothetical protein PENTCL1PPCAC_8604, partial [Pristionchus entomophagus]
GNDRTIPTDENIDEDEQREIAQQERSDTDSDFDSESNRIQLEIEKLLSDEPLEKAELCSLQEELNALTKRREIVEEVKRQTARFDSKFVNEFTVCNILSGGNVCLFEVEALLGGWKYAVKRFAVTPSKDIMEEAMREIRTLAQLDHPGIIRYYASWIEKPPEDWQEHTDELMLKDNECKYTINYRDYAFIYLQTQWCEYSLEEWLIKHATLSSRSLARTKSWFKQLLAAVAYIHKKGLIHGNLQPSNIVFVEEDQLKISDFKIDLSSGYQQHSSGTLDRRNKKLYMSPEQMQSPPNCSSKSDVFTLGLILVELCAVIPKEKAQDFFDCYRMGACFFPSLFEDNQAVEQFVTWFTNVKDTDRPTCKEILEHPFLREYEALESSPCTSKRTAEQQVFFGDELEHKRLKIMTESISNDNFNVEATGHLLTHDSREKSEKSTRKVNSYKRKSEAEYEKKRAMNFDALRENRRKMKAHEEALKERLSLLESRFEDLRVRGREYPTSDLEDNNEVKLPRYPLH